ncbi:hypothetical protein LguiA_008451 [Lonicera macranthoides]
MLAYEFADLLAVIYLELSEAFSKTFTMTLLTSYDIAVPSGLFIPVMLAGGSYGWIVGTLLGPVSNLDVGLFALLGAASFLSGSMRMTHKEVGNVMRALKMTRHNRFPVIDHPRFTDAPVLCGLVLRSHLLVLLQGKKFTKDGVDGE